MGFRFRKSINLGGGFRINISKSGVGYSWGTKGFRVTQKSTGGTRTTVSIPGTGMSWVNETGGGAKQRPKNPSQSYPNPVQPTNTNVQTYDTRTIENADAAGMVSAGLEELLALATSVLKTYKFIMVCFWVSLAVGCFLPLLWMVSVALLIYSFIYKSQNAVSLDYSIDENCRAEIEANLAPWIKITQSSKVWRIVQTSRSADVKYTSGAQNLVKRVECKKSTKALFPFTTKEKVASFGSSGETLIFLPDKLLVIQGSKIGALNYSDIAISATGTRFVESQLVPRDALVVDHTWEYVNKSGGPDRRFKNNRRLPVCHYGEITLTSRTGLNTVLMFSNINLQ